jgi:LmbE family N-acetylglucosaminyl deacetylase
MNWPADREIGWDDLSRRLTAVPPDASLRLMVLAAHPDDETIGASVLLAGFPNSSVIYVTDGAPRDPRFWTGGSYGSREQYAQTREAEALRALAHAGISQHRVFWLRAVDQEAVFEVPRLAAHLAKLLEEFRPHVIVTHPYEGGHPDHDTAALVARMALLLLKTEMRPAVVEMTSYHARNGKCVTGEFLNSELSSQIRFEEIRFELSAEDRERKQKMIRGYASQRLILENFPIDRERLREAPEYDFTEPPHPGKVWYECMGWPMTGARWRELAKAAMAELQEHSCP